MCCHRMGAWQDSSRPPPCLPAPAWNLMMREGAVHVAKRKTPPSPAVAAAKMFSPGSSTMAAGPRSAPPAPPGSAHRSKHTIRLGIKETEN
jgi:hypothetical protein